MDSTAGRLASWCARLAPTDADLELAGRALTDTVAVLVAARTHELRRYLDSFAEAGGWGVLAHALDFDDLHMPSTTHISTVCVPAALATGGGARSYLAGAGVMARLGIALGWRHYTAGWHATCAAGALGAAAAAGVSLGLDEERLVRALALAVPAAGGVQRAFGTDAKPLQVGMAVDAGVRAARLAAAGATADPTAVDQWLALVDGESAAVPIAPEAVPGGLAVKLFPCCYAIQRPIHAIRSLGDLNPATIGGIRVRALAATTQPLIHHRPSTGAQGKFSLEYGLAAALLDGWPGLASFTDRAVLRPEAQRLVDLVSADLTPGGDGLLDGEVWIEVDTPAGTRVATLAETPGSPDLPATEAQLAAKLADCLGGRELAVLDWANAADTIRRALA